MKETNYFIESKRDIRLNLLDILTRTRKAINEDDPFELSKLSNKTIHSASVYQDSENIAVAVFVYSMSKIISREHYKEQKDWPEFISAFMAELDKAIENLKINNLFRFRENIANIQKSIDSLSGHLRDYIKDIFLRASINKASRIYEHGISMSQTAHVLGIMPWELAEYSGRTGISDVNLSITQNIRTRLKKAFEILE
jgi:hypothetical protein